MITIDFDCESEKRKNEQATNRIIEIFGLEVIFYKMLVNTLKKDFNEDIVNFIVSGLRCHKSLLKREDSFVLIVKFGQLPNFTVDNEFNYVVHVPYKREIHYEYLLSSIMKQAKEQVNRLKKESGIMG